MGSGLRLRISNLPLENAVREAYDAQVARFKDNFKQIQAGITTVF